MKSKKTLRHVFMLPALGLLAFWPFGVALAQTGRYHDWHMMPGMMGHWGYGWFGGIFMVVFWILVLVGLIFLIRWLVLFTGRNKTDGDRTDAAIEILRERYARGEIGKEEFESKRKDLAG